MATFVEMDDRVTLSTQMDQNIGPVILINEISVDPENIEEFLKVWAKDANIMKQHQDLSQPNCTEVLQVAVCSLIMLFGNLLIVISGRLTILTCLNYRISLQILYLLIYSRKLQYLESVWDESFVTGL